MTPPNPFHVYDATSAPPRRLTLFETAVAVMVLAALACIAWVFFALIFEAGNHSIFRNGQSTWISGSDGRTRS